MWYKYGQKSGFYDALNTAPTSEMSRQSVHQCQAVQSVRAVGPTAFQISRNFQDPPLPWGQPSPYPTIAEWAAHPHVVPLLRIRGRYLHCPSTPSWRGQSQLYRHWRVHGGAGRTQTWLHVRRTSYCVKNANTCGRYCTARSRICRCVFRWRP